jgi:hypothetical protein
MPFFFAPAKPRKSEYLSSIDEEMLSSLPIQAAGEND